MTHDEQRIRIMELDGALDAMHARAERAEAEVAELKKRKACGHPSYYFSKEHDNFYCSSCKQGLGESFYLCRKELTTLQQDVGPLVEELHSLTRVGDGLVRSITSRVLETFLEKHPELKP